MLNVAVLVSGGGTNLQALINAEKAGEIKDGRIALCISSNADAYALSRAKAAGISCQVLAPEEYATLSDYSDALMETLEREQIGLIVLAGFLVILEKKVTDRFKNRIINVHPITDTRLLRARLLRPEGA